MQIIILSIENGKWSQQIAITLYHVVICKPHNEHLRNFNVHFFLSLNDFELTGQ